MKNYEFLIKLLKRLDFKNFYKMLKLNFACPVSCDETLCDDFKQCYDCWYNWLVSAYAKLDEVKD